MASHSDAELVAAITDATLIRLPHPIGTWVRDRLTGYEGAVVKYHVFADLSMFVDVERVDDRKISVASFAASRVLRAQRPVAGVD